MKKTIIVLLLVAAIALALYPLHVATWERPANAERSPHMFQNADWATCVWYGDRIIWCGSGRN
jgi:hypothetical protein